MTSQKYPLRINVGFISNQMLGYSRDFHFEYDTILLQPDFKLEQFKGVARISRNPQGLLAQVEFSAVAEAECVRCLDTFKQPLHTEFSELYAFSSRSVSESGLILPEDGNIDFGPVAREYLLIEMPISPLCRPDCKGLCIECGENLNHAVCEHHAENAHV